MSDLFGNLAQTANGTQSQVRPQLGSRFGAPPPLAGEDLPGVREAAGLLALTLPALVLPDGARAELPLATLRQMRLAAPLDEASSVQPALDEPADDAGMDAELPASDNSVSAEQFTATEPPRDATMRPGGSPLAHDAENQATEPAAAIVPSAPATALQSPNAPLEVADDAQPERLRTDQPAPEMPFVRDMAAGRDGPTMHAGADAPLRPAGVEAAPGTTNAPAPTSPVAPTSELPRPEAAPESQMAASRLSSHSSATEHLAPLAHDAAPKTTGTRGNERAASSPSETGSARREPPRASTPANASIVSAGSVDQAASGMRARAATPQGDNGLQEAMGIAPVPMNTPQSGAVVPSQPIVREQTLERHFSSQAPEAQSAPASTTPTPEMPTVLSAELSITSDLSSASPRQVPAHHSAPAREASIAPLFESEQAGEATITPLFESAHNPKRTGSAEAETPRHALAHAGEPASETIVVHARESLRESAKPRDEAQPATEKDVVSVRDEPIGRTSEAMSSVSPPRHTTSVEPTSEAVGDGAKHRAVPTAAATSASSRQSNRPAPPNTLVPETTARMPSNDAPALVGDSRVENKRAPAEGNLHPQYAMETTVALVPPHEWQPEREPAQAATRAAPEQLASAQTRTEARSASSTQNGAPAVANSNTPGRQPNRESLIEPAARQPMNREQSTHDAERSAIRPALKPGTRATDGGPQRGAHAETPANQPTIRVSIGRVEVRAIETPALLPRRSNRAPAGLSLDAYLRGDRESV